MDRTYTAPDIVNFCSMLLKMGSWELDRAWNCGVEMEMSRSRMSMGGRRERSGARGWMTKVLRRKRASMSEGSIAGKLQLRFTKN
jgi:hypothetical protein